MNSEFYPGWLDHWAEQHQTRNAAEFAIYLDKILALNASVNMYMFEGGTNFGFMNGMWGNMVVGHSYQQTCLDSSQISPQAERCASCNANEGLLA